MKILILSWRGPRHPNAGGAEYVVMKHAEGWAKAGHDVTLFTSSFSGAAENETINSVRVIRKGDQVFGVRFAAVKYFFENNKFDLIVDEFHGIPFFTPLFVKGKKLATIHEVTKEVWKLNPWPKPFNLIPWVVGSIFERFIFLFYTNVPFMTVSESTKTDLTKWGVENKNIHVIYNGFSEPKGVLPKIAKNKTAMYLGALAEDKGINDALHSFKLLHKKDQNWQFYIAGGGDKKHIDEIAAFVKKHNLTKNLTYFGFVSEKKKYELLVKAHVLINPSIREGWGLVNIEANAVGTPVVGYNVSGIKDSIVDGETGILCKNKSSEALAEATDKLVSDKKRYKAMSQNAISWSKKFNWNSSTKQSLELVESLVL